MIDKLLDNDAWPQFEDLLNQFILRHDLDVSSVWHYKSSYFEKDLIILDICRAMVDSRFYYNDKSLPFKLSVTEIMDRFNESDYLVDALRITLILMLSNDIEQGQEEYGKMPLNDLFLECQRYVENYGVFRDK